MANQILTHAWINDICKANMPGTLIRFERQVDDTERLDVYRNLELVGSLVFTLIDRCLATDDFMKRIMQPLFDKVNGKSALQVQYGGKHYKKLAIQPVEYIHANGIDYFSGSAIKYLSRWKEKGGIQDLRKAIHFIEFLIEFEEKKNKDGGQV